jgi:ABC-2 type transport system permease protein
MDKLWLIIKREYLTRVKKRSFILATLLTPLAFALFFGVVGFIFSYESGEKLRIAIVDKDNIFDGNIADGNNLIFKFENRGLEELRSDFENTGYSGIIVIPSLKNITYKNYTVAYYSDNQLGLDISSNIERKISDKIRDYKIEELKLDKDELKSLKTSVTLNPEPINPLDKDESPAAGIVAAAIGGIMGFIMYMTVFIYGMMVMRSVMEEKTSRIVEVMISSVRPFQLMMGKIIGVGAVGLTQVAIWAVLIPGLYLLVMLLFDFDPEQMNAATSAGSEVDMEEVEGLVAQAITEIGNINWWAIVPLFIFYFLGGYFLYSSMFAAVGSAMGDDMGEGQALTIPITIPVIMALYIMMVAVRAPQSNLAVWSSIFPLFSPIVMPARLAFNPPLWEIILSMVVLAGTSVFFVWISARIYRVGIFMYGKKVSFKEIGKWLFYKG